MSEDQLDHQLTRSGLRQHFESKKEPYFTMISHFLETWKAVYPHVEISSEVINRLIWEIIRVDPLVSTFFLANDGQYYEEFAKFEFGFVSKRMVNTIKNFIKQDHADLFESF